VLWAEESQERMNKMRGDATLDFKRNIWVCSLIGQVTRDIQTTNNFIFIFYF
jgi:hypothetical protein